ncbi:MAG: hypothetical protein WA432_00220 [Candidatus Babeliaceae bacterium]
MMRRLFLLLICLFAGVLVARKRGETTDQDHKTIDAYKRSIDPQAQSLIAHLLNIMINSVYAGAADDDTETRNQHLQQVITSVASVANLLFILPKKSAASQSGQLLDEESAKTIEDFLSQDYMRRMIEIKLEIYRPLFIKACQQALKVNAF